MKRKKMTEESNMMKSCLSLSFSPSQSLSVIWITSLFFLVSSEKIFACYSLVYDEAIKMKSSHILLFFTHRNIWSSTGVHSGAFTHHLDG